jgi:hypothetical protein
MDANTMKLFAVFAVMLCVGPVSSVLPYSSDAVPIPPSSSLSGAKPSILAENCPETTPNQERIATSLIDYVLASDLDHWVSWREAVGLSDQMRHTVRVLTDATKCGEINAVAPYIQDGRIKRAYLIVNERVYISVPAYNFIGINLLISFDGVIGEETLVVRSIR